MDVITPAGDAGLSVAYTGTAGNTGTFKPGPSAVMVWATTDCYVKVGEGVTATSADLPIPAYTPVPIAVPKGSGAVWRVSAIQISAGGTVYAKPITGALA
jgi:hypothetical protein